MKNVFRVVIFTIALLLPAFAVQAQSTYQIRPGDTLVIEVLEDPGLNRSVPVLPDGSFSFPFTGPLRAGGRTVDQVQAAIGNAISSNFAATPNVFVTVQPQERLPKAAGPARAPRTIDVFFMGEMASPGRAELKPGTTLLQAIATGGGFTRFAATKRVQLRRTDPKTGQQSVTQINYKALVDGALATTDIELTDGDIILVPERRLFE